MGTHPVEGKTEQRWEDRVREISACRICGNPQLEPVINLGAQSLAGLFDDGKPQNQLDTPIPLSVIRCSQEANPKACGFVQLKQTVPPDIMFRDYGYRSGINTTMKRHLQALSQDIESKIAFRDGDIVVDIGANDGTSLRAYQHSKLTRVGFEPSDVRPEDPEHGIHYVPTFFNKESFQADFPGQRARVITSIATFYDIDDPVHFCSEIGEILSEDGIWVLEMSYWGDVLENNGFDAICHEHLGYYTLGTLQHLFRKTGFEFLDISFNSANGGSVRCTLMKTGARREIPAENRDRIAAAFHKEAEKGFHRQERHAIFRDNAEQIRSTLRDLLKTALAQGKKIYGYGASTKGNVLLQYCGIGPKHLVAIADRNPAKEGRFTLGTHIPICSEEQMRRAKPDFLLILPWHFLPEFREREKSLLSSGTKFIVPFPAVRVF